MYKGSKRAQVEHHSSLKYPHQLNFYDQPPLEDVSIEDFETYALDRLRILSEIESSFVRNRSWDELKSITLKQSDAILPLNASTATSKGLDGERRKDHIGHFVLRLAFCRSEELRRRFVKAEVALFRIRYERCDKEELDRFLKHQNFDWIEVSEAEKEEHKRQLIAALSPYPHNAQQMDRARKEPYFKVRWSRVPDLIERRKVFLKAGMAFIPARELASLVYQEFQTQLERSLELTAKALPRLDEDTRIIPILDNLSRGFLAGVSSDWGGASNPGSTSEITADMVDEIAQKHFPMCMRHLHDTLRKDRLLKHFGRLQYGLFLKVLGLSIEEAIVFWRKSFSNTQDDKFNKDYRYNIRHSYGLEGKRANYAAKSCQQILMADKPGSSDNHGCPFRHFAAENLQSALLAKYSSQGLQASDLPEVMHIVKSEHYHVACTRVFEITHAKHVSKGEGIGGGESVTHPNQYTARSRELEASTLIPKGDNDDVVMK